MKPFENLLGDTCELRLLDFFMGLVGTSFTVSELSEEVNRPVEEVEKVLKKFAEYGIVKLENGKYIIKHTPYLKCFEDLNNLLVEKILTKT